MTSLAGGAVQRLSPEQIASGGETGLRPIESVHHQTRSGRNTRLFAGSYDFHLRLQDGAWKIDLFRSG